MAATAFAIYGKAKYKIGKAVINLSTGNYRLKLCTSAASAAVVAVSTRSLLSSCTPEISARGGYVAGGRLLASSTKSWTAGASAKSYKWDVPDLIFTASGSSLINVKYAVIGASVSGAVHALCYSKLSTAQFTVTSPNTLTIVFDTLGVFEVH